MNLADYLYDRLPKVYQAEDKEQLLRRFIDTFVEAGFNPLLEDTTSITDLLDVDKCPSKFLPQLCSMYGYEYTLEIPELFQRRLLKHIVEMYKRKGTKSVVKFIARELTGFESEIIENKDFTEEHIELTHWDIRFEHYRNFILKLTAPYEDSNLFNKEEIVVKIINDFLPTNSQVLVITAYWFKEETEIVKKSVEDILDLVKDYNVEVSTVRKQSSYLDSVFCKHDLIEYHHTLMGEEDSYLNPPYNINLPLYTNAVVKIRDTITFAPESYSNFIKGSEDYSHNAFNMIEGHYINSLESYKEFADLRHKVKISPYLELSSLVSNSTQVIIDTLKPLVETEEATPRANTYEYDRIFKVSVNPEMEILEEGRINHNSYDIINTVEEETFNYELKVLSQQTTKLNLSPVLMTNSIHCYDVVKVVGKPDEIILL